jgi:hypothetical protein
MSHACGCRNHVEAAGARLVGIAKPCQAGPAITPEQTVDEVSRRSPRALAVLKELGINHCCGAHLTLTQAAASAGIPLDTLLRALAETVSAPA